MSFNFKPSLTRVSIFAFIDSSKNNVLIQMMSQLSSNLDSMGARLERRISDIESNVDKTYAERITVFFVEFACYLYAL
jgi:hypothetical protein